MDIRDDIVEYSGFKEDVCAMGITATTLSVLSLFLLVLVRHALVPVAHYNTQWSINRYNTAPRYAVL